MGIILLFPERHSGPEGAAMMNTETFDRRANRRLAKSQLETKP